jgi:hypothetical protein
VNTHNDEARIQAMQDDRDGDALMDDTLIAASMA